VNLPPLQFNHLSVPVANSEVGTLLGGHFASGLQLSRVRKHLVPGKNDERPAGETARATIPARRDQRGWCVFWSRTA
jgi:hypothetical protein